MEQEVFFDVDSYFGVEFHNEDVTIIPMNTSTTKIQKDFIKKVINKAKELKLCWAGE